MKFDAPMQKSLSEALHVNAEDFVSFHFDDKSGKLIVEVKNLDVIKQAKPNSGNLMAIPFSIGVRGISVTSGNLDNSDLKKEGYDFASRYFAPWVGLDEDPVNGSSHTILAGFYNERFGKKKIQSIYGQ